MPPPQGTPNPIEGPGDYTTTRTVHSDVYDAISPTLLDLSGRAVFITGASRGVGEQIALAYAAAGASFIAIGARADLTKQKEALLQAAKDAKRKEPVILPLSLNVADPASVDNAVTQAWEKFGRLDIVVNNAGILGNAAFVADSDPDNWWSVMETNLRGPYLVARKSIPHLLESKDGLKTLVTVASVGALKTSPGLSGYQTSKLAVLRVTDFIAEEYADKGIIAINIHPGNMLTDIISKEALMNDELMAVFTETTRLPGQSIVFLTAERREWLSGRYVNVTWDLPQLFARKDEIVKGDLLKVKLDVPKPFED